MNLHTFFAYDPHDTDEIRFEKFSALLVAGSCTLAGVVWFAMYYFIFGWSLTTFLPLAFVIIVGSALVISHFRRNHQIAIYAQIISIIYITALIQWSIGGVFDSGFVLVWSFIGPVCALMFFSVRRSIAWFLLYLLNLVITVVFNGYFASHGLVVAEHIKLIFFLMNLGIASIVVFLFAGYYVNAAIKEHRNATRLLDENLQQEIVLRQNEKLATLGKLSAGVAHELNNPASAAKRGVEQLKDTTTKLEAIRFELFKSQLSQKQIDDLVRHTEKIKERARQPFDLDPLTRSDQESEIESWLQHAGVENYWDIAPTLVNAGYDCAQLTELRKVFSDSEFPLIVALLSHLYGLWNLIEEIGQGSSRVSEIVKSLKSYTYLDQAPLQFVDIHEGLDDTLIMLRSKLKAGVKVHREYAANLPEIEGFGSELNQVWTNIIDNAVSAMDGKGEIILRTFLDDSSIVVEIQDDGPGIPLEIQTKIFDPFFTTKPPGEGTGLGLNISHNIIVQKHQGNISVSSKPGNTCFQVRLPINPDRKKIIH